MKLNGIISCDSASYHLSSLIGYSCFTQLYTQSVAQRYGQRVYM